MIQQLREAQVTAGAALISIADMEAIASFDNDAAALEAAKTGVALYDRTHWGRIQMTGADRLRFLHNQSTSSIQSLQPGQGCDTVFVTQTARTIDLVSAYILEDEVLLLTSPDCRQSLVEWMDRFIFPFDKVTLKNITSGTAAFSLIGDSSDALLTQLGGGAIVGQPLHSHQCLNLADVPVRVAVGSGLTSPGYTVFLDADAAPDFWKMLVDRGAVPLGETAWEQLRIQQGRPMPGRELTEDYNPLEAGLWQTISFTKGCYIGQETIARLDTYKGVKQQLWGVRLSALAQPGDPVFLGQEKIGKLTSLTQTDAGIFGLVYIRTKAGGAGLTVTIAGAEAEVVDVPFLTHDRVD